MPVDAIDTEAVLSVLKPLWTRAPETASRLRGRIEQILDAAKARGFIGRNEANPARWRGHLDKLLPKRAKLTRGHHAAMPYADVPAFIASLRERPATAARALEFCILTAARSGEALAARWDEIDFDGKIWTVPPARTKAAREHRVPLSDRALAILREMEAGANRRLCVSPAGGPAARFPAWRSKCCCGASARPTRRTASDASFRDWAGNETTFPARACRTRACACHRRQGRTSLPAIRRARAAARAYGRLGAALRGRGRRERLGVQEAGLKRAWRTRRQAGISLDGGKRRE